MTFDEMAKWLNSMSCCDFCTNWSKCSLDESAERSCLAGRKNYLKQDTIVIHA